MDGYITTKEAAALLHCAQGHVARLFHAGRINGKLISPRLLLVERASIEAYTPTYANSWEGQQAGLRPIERSQPYHHKEA